LTASPSVTSSPSTSIIRALRVLCVRQFNLRAALVRRWIGMLDVGCWMFKKYRVTSSTSI
jgi:hypothetical protein